MKYTRTISVVSLILLSACSSNTVKDTLGLDRAPPDEFRVVSRPPLSVPPQFTLQPPNALAQAPNQLPTSAQAESMLTGIKPTAGVPGTVDTTVIPVTSSPVKAPIASRTPATGAESAFLQQAGADKADPTVRDKLVEEKITIQDRQEEKSWWDFSSDAPKETIVDANKESQRIQTDTNNGQPVTTGDTAVVKQKDTGVLGSVFGY